MITELQNQDPLNPLDNKDMLAQISQIREVGATDKLTKRSTRCCSARTSPAPTNLIGADISALSDDGESVDGHRRSRFDRQGPAEAARRERDRRSRHPSEDGNIDSRHVRLSRRVGRRQGQSVRPRFVRRRRDHDDRHRRRRPRDPARQSAGDGGAETGLSHRFQRRRAIISSSARSRRQQGTFVDKLSDDERSSTRADAIILANVRNADRPRPYEVSLNNIVRRRSDPPRPN